MPMLIDDASGRAEDRVPQFLFNSRLLILMISGYRQLLPRLLMKDFSFFQVYDAIG